MSSQSPPNFERIKDEDIGLMSSEEAYDIVEIFESVLNSSSESTVDESAVSFSTQLIASTPQDSSSKESRTFVWNAWQAIIRIASCIPPQHHGQDILVKTISKLGEAGLAWEHLPEFGSRMRDSWNYSPSFNPEGNDVDEGEFSQSEWLNLNSFVARLHASRITNFDNCATWELRAGFEDNESIPPALFYARVRVACEWMIRSSSRILEDSLLGINTETPKENQGDPYGTGPLFPGSRGFNLERWGWWKRRLVEIRENPCASIHTEIDEAVRKMTETEIGLGSQKLSNKPEQMK